MVEEAGIPSDRVVAVVVTLSDGREQWGSGYLLDGRSVLTAEHCTRDKATGAAPQRLRVVRASDGSSADADMSATVAAPELDVAVISLGTAPWAGDLSPVPFGRVERTRSGMLVDCEAIGFPLFQREASERKRYTAELHGTIYQTDEARSGHLLMKEPLIHPGSSDMLEAGEDSPWGGLSGALIFYRGRGIGVVVEHHPRQGDSALLARPFDTIMEAAATSPTVQALADRLELRLLEELTWVNADPVTPLGDLVDVLVDDELPVVETLNPYRVGTTVSDYGDEDSYGERDPYVARTHNDIDQHVRSALEPGQFVLIVGPATSGKTRTAFEAVKVSWPHARLVSPVPAQLATLVDHPRVKSTTDPLVVWLDDLQRYLVTTAPLTLAALARLTERSGPTFVVATLRQEERARLASDTGEISRDVRTLLQSVRHSTFEVSPTSDDPVEQAAAQGAYPSEDLTRFGLAEQLAGGPTLVQQYHDARYEDPLFAAVVQVVIDWVRVGMPRPIPERDLVALSGEVLLAARPDLDATDDELTEVIKRARTAPVGAGRVAALETVRMDDRSRAYRAFSYLVAADDGHNGDPREIQTSFWQGTLSLADPDDAAAIGLTASHRENLPVAIQAMRVAAVPGNANAMGLLAYLLYQQEPPDIEQARGWFTRGSEAGDTDCMNGLAAVLLQVDPPQVDDARRWLTCAIKNGHVGARALLGILLSSFMDPPEREEARRVLTEAVEMGSAQAMTALGQLLARSDDPLEHQEADRWYARAATAGDTYGMYLHAQSLAGQDPPQMPEARDWLERAAEAGVVPAMNEFGWLLASSDPRDLEQANHWLTRAAGKGNADAMNNLGVLHEHADPPEVDEARDWYRRAAEAGSARAALNFLRSLEAPDASELEEARQWLTAAAERNNKEAMVNLGFLYQQVFVPPDLDEARHWYARAAEAGHAKAMYNLGVLYHQVFVPPDLDEARRWYTRAAAAGDAEAMNNMGVLLEHGDPAEVDTARDWYRRAAEAGSAPAVVNHLRLLEAPDATELEEARQRLTAAAETDNADAMFSLGVLLQQVFVPPDLGEARRWYKRAADAGRADAMNNLGMLLEHADPPEVDAARDWYARGAAAGSTDAASNLERVSGSDE